MVAFFIVKSVAAVLAAVVAVVVVVKKNLLKYPGHYTQRFRANTKEVG